MTEPMQWEKFSRDQFDAGYAAGYGAAMDDGWGEPGHIKEALSVAAQRVMELPDLSDAGFTYSGLLHRAAVIDAIRGES